MNIDLTGKRALVCGSTQGIGKAIALELASLGANLTLMARNETKLQETIDSLSPQKQEHHYLVADFNFPDQVQSQIVTYLQNHNISILINNTGGPPPGLAIESVVTDYINAFQNHLVCNQILTQACVPKMKDNKYGRIINIISSSVKVPIPGLGVSNTIRGAVASWAKTLAAELGPFGITVNNLLPGLIHTSRLESLVATKSTASGIDPEAIKQQMINEIPVGRFGNPTEIAAAAGFLASPAASYINGINLPVDGGKIPCL